MVVLSPLVLPVMVTVAFRDCEVVAFVTVTVTVPLLVPSSGEMMHQEPSLLVAVHASLLVTVIVCGESVASALKESGVELAVVCGATPDCVIEIGTVSPLILPLIVTVAVRGLRMVLSSTDT